MYPRLNVLSVSVLMFVAMIIVLIISNIGYTGQPVVGSTMSMPAPYRAPAPVVEAYPTLQPLTGIGG